MAGLRPVSGTRTASVGSAWGFSVSVSPEMAPQPDDVLIAVAFGGYSTVPPTISGGPGGGAWTTVSTEGGQPVATVAVKTLTSGGSTAVTASVPSSDMLYLFVFSAYGYKPSLDDVQWSFDNNNDPASQARVTSTQMIAPAAATPSATGAAPDQPISLHCTFYDAAALPTFTDPAGATPASAPPDSAGGYGTMALAYTYAPAGTTAGVPSRTTTSSRPIYSTNVQLTLWQPTPAVVQSGPQAFIPFFGTP